MKDKKYLSPDFEEVMFTEEDVILISETDPDVTDPDQGVTLPEKPM